VEAGDGRVELAARPGGVSRTGHHQGGVLANVTEPGRLQGRSVVARASASRATRAESG
jgi:hypothetical protein